VLTKHTKINNILGYKLNPNKFEIIEIIESLFSSHNGIKLEINNSKTIRKALNSWKLRIQFGIMCYISLPCLFNLFKLGLFHCPFVFHNLQCILQHVPQTVCP
jgi:hypothetical protein